jgi:hypothetical protein
MTEQSTESSLPPSKRAARRILQRAFVLAGRDRPLRQHIREDRFTTLWILEDWDLAWTVIVERGKIEFERRPAKHPDLTFSWPTADEFFSSATLSFRSRNLGRGLSAGSFQSENPLPRLRDRKDRDASDNGAPPEGPLRLTGNLELRRVANYLLNCFLGYLGHVLRNPVDGAGESLL